MATPPPLQLTPNSDVTLLCGENVGDGKITTLHASSAVLIHCSPVFKALLSSRFREGSTLAAESKVEIPLPEDDGDSMTLLCQAVHFRHDDLPDVLSTTRITALADLCDKYNCAPLIRSLVQCWTANNLPDADQDELKSLYATAVRLGCVRIKQDVGRKLVMVSTLVDDVPSEIAIHVAKMQSIIVSFVSSSLNDWREYAGTSEMCEDDHCSAGMTRLYLAMDTLEETELMPGYICERTLEETCQRMENLSMPELKEWEFCGISCVERKMPLRGYAGGFHYKAGWMRRCVEALPFA